MGNQLDVRIEISAKDYTIEIDMTVNYKDKKQIFKTKFTPKQQKNR